MIALMKTICNGIIKTISEKEDKVVDYYKNIDNLYAGSLICQNVNALVNV